MDAAVVWKEGQGLAFSGVGSSTNYTIALAAKPEVGQVAQGASPMELLLMALAGCTSFDVLSILQKKRQDVTGFEVRVHAERATEHPMVFTHITLEYVISGHHVEQAAVERAIELSLTKYCPAHAMISKAAPVEHTYHIIETAPVEPK
jgi:putative redox protein